MSGKYDKFKSLGKKLYMHCIYSQEISNSAIIPERIVDWLTTRKFPGSVWKNASKVFSVGRDLEANEWSGVDEEGNPIAWNGWNMKKCTRLAWADDLGNGPCTSNERKRIFAGDISLMHVYFKDLNIRKYLKEENFGVVDAIGNNHRYKHLINI